MKNRLTYQLTYTPEKDVENNIDFLCFDNKIHIRLRDYEREEVVSGFINKLTYLLTYLVNYSWANKIVSAPNSNAIISSFLSQNEDAELIIRTISNKIMDKKFKGISITTNYRRTKCNPLGSISKDLLPKNTSGEVSFSGDLSLFLNKLHISLADYLFNDGYELVLHKDSFKTPYTKFHKKAAKKVIKESKKEKEIEYVSLWQE